MENSAVAGGQLVGGSSQVYRAGRFAGYDYPSGTRRFLSGVPSDQLSKLLGNPTGTFTATRPADAEPIVQVIGSSDGSCALLPDVNPSPADPVAAFWTGPYNGSIDGRLELTGFWSTSSPIHQVQDVLIDVTVWADLRTGDQALVGKVRYQLVDTSATPRKDTLVVPVRGTARQTLTIQVEQSCFNNPVADATEMRITYGSAAHDSSFALLPPDAKPQSTPAEYEGEVLAVQAVSVGVAGFEPTIGIRQDGVAFFEAFHGPMQPAHVMRSMDGGNTWADVSPTLPTGHMRHSVGFDPYVHVDVTTGRVFAENQEAIGCSEVSFSDDMGSNWTHNPLGCGEPLTERPGIVTGTPPANLVGRMTGYPNVVYYCSLQFLKIGCTRSLDGGRSFAPVTAPFPGYDLASVGPGCGNANWNHSHPVTDGAGRLIMGTTYCRDPWIAISDDGGDSWHKTRVHLELQTPPVWPMPQIAADDGGNIYYLWLDGRFRLPWLAVSSDEGRSWSEPLMVAPPGVNEAFHPAIAGGADGRILLSFIGTTDSPERGPQRWNEYVAVSTNASSADPVFLSATANVASDPVWVGECAPLSCPAGEFYDAQIAPNGEGWAAYVDACTGECVGADPEPVSRPGIAVRQLCGPALRGEARALHLAQVCPFLGAN